MELRICLGRAHVYIPCKYEKVNHWLRLFVMGIISGKSVEKLASVNVSAAGGGNNSFKAFILGRQC